LSLTHIWGELDLDLTKSFKQIFEKIFDISEACGYFPDRNNNKTEIIVSGSDNCICKIHFKNNKVDKVRRAQFSDSGKIIVPWQNVIIGSYEVMF